MKDLYRPAMTLFALLTVLTGIVYPLTATVAAQWLFPHAANGSLITVDGTVIGSALIGQHFSSPRYFWGRPSATGPRPYHAAASAGSNLGPLNPALTDAVKARLAALRSVDPQNGQAVPIDLVTASASGLDPEISLAAAYYQAQRVARVRQVAPDLITALIERHARHPWLGIFGEPRVNVLHLNLALDGMD